MTHLALVILFGLALLPALALAFVPLFPTFWYLLGIAALFGAVDGFVHLTLQNFLILLGMFGASVLVDWSAGLLGAKFGGAGWKSILLGAVGGFIGFLMIPPIGAFAGIFLGVVAGEILRAKSMGSAMRAGAGSVIGALTGVALNVILAVAFIVLFIVFAVA